MGCTYTVTDEGPCGHAEEQHGTDQEVDLDGRPLGAEYLVCFGCLEEERPYWSHDYSGAGWDEEPRQMTDGGPNPDYDTGLAPAPQQVEGDEERPAYNALLDYLCEWPGWYEERHDETVDLIEAFAAEVRSSTPSLIEGDREVASDQLDFMRNDLFKYLESKGVNRYHVWGYVHEVVNAAYELGRIDSRAPSPIEEVGEEA